MFSLRHAYPHKYSFTVAYDGVFSYQLLQHSDQYPQGNPWGGIKPIVAALGECALLIPLKGPMLYSGHKINPLGAFAHRHWAMAVKNIAVLAFRKVKYPIEDCCLVLF